MSRYYHYKSKRQLNRTQTVTMYIKIIVLFLQITKIYGLTCQEILEQPEDRKLTLQELQTIQPMEITECLPHLGKEKLSSEEADYIWKSMVKLHNGVANIPDSVLMLLHWVTPALSPEDYENITLNNVDVIQNFGLNYDLTENQLAALAYRIREDFASKQPEDYTYYDLTAIRQILCAFNRSEIERIRPSAYREASLLIGKLEKCNSDVMQGFATLAVQPSAFGNPSSWTDSTLETVGAVAKFLPEAVGKSDVLSLSPSG